MAKSMRLFGWLAAVELLELFFGEFMRLATTGLGMGGGVYSFFNHLDWIRRVEPVYGASITARMALNHNLFR